MVPTCGNGSVLQCGFIINSYYSTCSVNTLANIEIQKE